MILMSRVKIWGGTHPDEKAAMKVVDSLESHPIPNVDSGIANPLARKLGRRFVDVNLVGAFPGDSGAPEYEKRRAVEVLAQSQGFDAVIDLHNINGYGENAGCIDRQKGVSPRVLGFLGSLGIRHLVATDYDGMHKYLRNAFVLETLTGGLGSDIEQLRGAFDRLANDPALPPASAADFTWFGHVGSPHVDTVTPDILGPELRKTLRGFDILPEEAAAAMGYPDKQVCLMGWLDKPNERGYWGELCEPIPVPDDSGWPRD
jgi:hypothetical protein